MRDAPPAITEAQLQEWERAHPRRDYVDLPIFAGRDLYWCVRCRAQWPCQTMALIEALRAAREPTAANPQAAPAPAEPKKYNETVLEQQALMVLAMQGIRDDAAAQRERVAELERKIAEQSTSIDHWLDVVSRKDGEWNVLLAERDAARALAAEAVAWRRTLPRVVPGNRRLISAVDGYLAGKGGADG